MDNGDARLQRADDGTSGQIQLSTPFPYFGELQSDIWASIPSRAVASPRAGGEHEKFFTPKKGFFGIVPPLCPP